MAGLRYMIISFLFLTTVAHTARAIVCLSNACETVRCANVLASSCTEDEVFMQEAGYCGCCSACLKKIKKGEVCVEVAFLGVPITTVCEEGSTCSKLVGTQLVCD